MRERIKLLRHILGLTQQKFADRLNIKGNTISQYESGRNEPIDAVVSLICREFNVNETWLRTGEGDMFKQAIDNPIEKLCTELHASELEAGIMRAYFKIDPKIRDSFMQRILQEVQAEYMTHGAALPTPEDQQAIWEAEARAEAEEYYREILAEKKAEAESSALQSDGGPLMGA